MNDEQIANIQSIITDDDIHYSVMKLKEKGIAWDFISHWVPKLLIRFTP